MKIYTKTGDQGETSLFDGTRVPKTDTRVVAYGDVDELQACLGLAIAAGLDAELGELAVALQRDLFALGARLADPAHRIAPRVTKIVVDERSVARLEEWIDRLENELPPLRHFVLAGGAPPGAAAVEDVVRIYLNRLSDLLFVMARAANHRAHVAETEW